MVGMSFVDVAMESSNSVFVLLINRRMVRTDYIAALLGTVLILCADILRHDELRGVPHGYRAISDQILLRQQGVEERY